MHDDVISHTLLASVNLRVPSVEAQSNAPESTFEVF